MLDVQMALTAFQNYTKNFDEKDPKIHLKLVHTMGVLKISTFLAKKLTLTVEEQQLAKIIALLHDIGRFEQLRRFNSFDDRNVDHATLAIELLQHNDFIRNFVKNVQYDELIYTAIKNHNTFAIEPNLSPATLLQTKLIRDADKLDNYRVKELETIETLFDISLAELEAEYISPRVFNEFKQHHLILRNDRETHLDMWLSYMAFLYDLNFSVSYKFLAQHNYLPKLFKRIQPKQASVAQQWQVLSDSAQAFLTQQIKENR